MNKADLKAKVSEQLLKDKLSWDTIAFSNETKQGLQQLEQYIMDKFERGRSAIQRSNMSYKYSTQKCCYAGSECIASCRTKY